MAHKKGGGATSQKKDSAGRRLGLKKSGSQQVVAGNIICRQRGTKWHPGENVGMGKDHTLFSLISGIVKFFKKGSKDKTYVSVISNEKSSEVKETKKVAAKKPAVKKEVKETVAKKEKAEKKPATKTTAKKTTKK